MDPVTHALAGMTIGKLGFKRKAALWVALISSVAPDLDYVTRFWGADMLLRYHRGVTHGALALFAVPLLIALIFGFRKGFFYFFSISFFSYAFHLLLDLTNQYGTRAMAPLDYQPYSFDLLFIIDPYVTISLLVGASVAAFNKKRAALAAVLTLALVSAYIGGRYYLHERAEEFCKRRLGDYVCRVYPLPNDFLRWWVVAKQGGVTRVGFIDMFTGRVCLDEAYPPPADDPAIENSKKSRAVRNFLYFAKYPYPEVRKQGGKTVVVWRELSYSFLPGERFRAKAVMDEAGRTLSSDFKF